MRKLTVSDFIADTVPELVAVVGAERTKAIASETARVMGDGGTAEEWVKAMAGVIAAGGSVAEMDAFRRGFDKWTARP